ncbi:single-stranded DNA-binding protein [Brachybacterium sp. GU-2]|uniref:single-stranded DNA-binding protein n=1 Tax=Brachybacterium sp. GU-2 TaxID=3069708 RepID=UPI00280C0764|nr:single-stranded DNA-binding protein [Brachybacterium sp. GU-2]WME22110.1 single-stranded DNA-binding protein [Brachybacterium sp. GU-2]
MPDARITIEGRIAADPRFSATHQGVSVGNLRVLAGRSKKDEQGNWQTLSTTAYQAAFWREHHDLLATLKPEKGDSVTITGTVEGVDSYDGPNGLSLSVRVNADGIRLFKKRQQGQQQGAPQSGYGHSQGAPQSDPWAGGGNQGGYDDPPF